MGPQKVTQKGAGEMAYKLAEQHGDSTAVPQLVMAHVARTDGDTVRVALYILQTGETDPKALAKKLGLKSVEAAKRALQYWTGAGLLVKERALPQPGPAPEEKMARTPTLRSSAPRPRLRWARP